jgi:hypothetical protein
LGLARIIISVSLISEKELPHLSLTFSDEPVKVTIHINSGTYITTVLGGKVSSAPLIIPSLIELPLDHPV